MQVFTLDQIKFVAVLVAGLATFFLGAIWYTALFGKLRAQLLGYTEEKLRELQAKRPPPIFLGGMLVSYLVLALVLAVVVYLADATSAGQGALIGFLLWLGPAACIGMTDHLASDRPIGVFFIDTSFQLIFLIMMGAILGGWR